MSSCGSARRSRPSNSIFPRSGSIKRSSMRARVVFPHPLSPTTANVSPLRDFKAHVVDSNKALALRLALERASAPPVTLLQPPNTKQAEIKSPDTHALTNRVIPNRRNAARDESAVCLTRHAQLTASLFHPRFMPTSTHRACWLCPASRKPGIANRHSGNAPDSAVQTNTPAVIP